MKKFSLVVVFAMVFAAAGFAQEGYLGNVTAKLDTAQLLIELANKEIVAENERLKGIIDDKDAEIARITDEYNNVIFDLLDPYKTLLESVIIQIDETPICDFETASMLNGVRAYLFNLIRGYDPDYKMPAPREISGPSQE